MTETDELQLLRDYAESRSEAAFAAIVKRHVNLVYSVALRRTANPHAAEEITQAVFIILARKAGSLGPRTILTGWLYQTARLTAANFLRGQIRRQNREQEAYVQSLSNKPEPEVWSQIAPLLDEALGKLGERDRLALVLRFFERQSLSEIGAALGASEDAAKMRVNRALKKLRRVFTKSGVKLTTTLIAGAVSANSVQAAPACLAVTVATTVTKGVTAAASITALVEGTMKTLTWLKLKFAAGVGAAAILAGGVVTFALSDSRMETSDPAAEAILNKVFEKYAALSTYSDSGKTMSGITTNTFSIHLSRPNLHLIVWNHTAASTWGVNGAAWSAGAGHFKFFNNPGLQNDPKRYERMKGLGETFDSVANVSGGAAFTIPPIFFGKTVSDQFGLLGLSSHFQKREDARVGGVECYVLTGRLKAARDLPVTLWIGKDDLLIRQIQRTTIEPITVIPLDTSQRQRLLDEWSRATTAEDRALIQKKIQTANALQYTRTPKRTIHTEVHENIVVNQPLTKADFIYEGAAGLKPTE